METARKIWGRVRPDRWRVVNVRTGTVLPGRYFTRWVAQDSASQCNEIAQVLGQEYTYEARWV